MGKTCTGERCFLDDDCDVRNASIVGNRVTATKTAEGVAVYLDGTKLDWDYCNVSGNVGGPEITGFDIADHEGNVAVDPGYTDVTGILADTWDLTLSSDSPLINAGDPAVLDADGTRSDIGAYGGPDGDGW